MPVAPPQRPHKISVGYHGTKWKNIPSIRRGGLLVPGEDDNEVEVKNGSVHGVGVYTAKLGCAQLSRGFCDSQYLFVCAICDTSVPIFDPHRFHEVALPQWKPSSTHVQAQFPPPPLNRQGNFQVSRRSGEVLHVGNAMVVFGSRFVTPLFLAWAASKEEERSAAPPPSLPLPPQTWEAPQQVGRRRVVLPEESGSGVLPGPGGRFETVWLSPKPLQAAAHVLRHGRAVQRRISQRTWQKALRRHRGARQLAQERAMQEWQED